MTNKMTNKMVNKIEFENKHHIHVGKTLFRYLSSKY
jgi:hypothetical protein